jgi:hypothetical protein
VGKYLTDHSTDLCCTLTGLIDINGTKAFTLFDSGMETDALSPDFIRACHILLLKLPNPLVLQMGTKGSRSCIYYRTNVDLRILGQSNKHYFNVMNIKQYDAILGAPWLNMYRALLDFGKHTVHVHGGRIPTFNIPMECTFVSTGQQAWHTSSGLLKRPLPTSTQATVALSMPKT